VPTKPSAVASEALGCLREDDIFAGDGGGDECAMGGALDLLDGVHGGEADDGGSELGDSVNGAVDGGSVNERTHGVMDEDDVVILCGESGEGVGDGLLAVIAAFDNADLAGEAVLGDLRLYALDLRLAHGDVDCRDPLDGRKSAQRVDQDGDAIEREKLLGLRTGHPCTEACRWKNYEYVHDSWSIHRAERREEG